ncbi:alpha-ribazole-5-phosphate synthase [Planococcus plakortidis]|uniref:Alpha-ribazole-5-phosphate synthase n=1 Tax=Planococcus plakortidis TaxID=1038856 RepID=A0A1C7E9U9_9BACL|nr:alpha-ribazole-5-phosphate synthase [Planococcus plakortidis]ANU20227.1 alpha-ribazole-5-phosphate synthase [Planococcus plakortidis]
MRNELVIDGLVITTDNSAAIGEKPHDIVHVPDEVAAKFAARVALAEQWAAGGEAIAILLHNFSGDLQWPRYVSGITQLFSGLDMPVPPVSGSTESNIETLQSALSVTIIGRKLRALADPHELAWFIYGEPLAGEEVINQPERIADLQIVKNALDRDQIERIWPVGSGGIEQEAEKLFGRRMPLAQEIDLTTSGGPATCLFIGVRIGKVPEAKRLFGRHFRPLTQ